MDRYGITEIAHLLGISTEALRKYEEKGILTSFRNDDTNYREYSASEFSTLLQARAYKQLGFSLKETASLLNDSELSRCSNSKKRVWQRRSSTASGCFTV